MAQNKQTGWTIRTVQEPPRGPVTKSTVTKLSGDKSLSGVKKIARKYAG